MKTKKLLAILLVLALCVLPLAACGQSQFGLSENSEKRMTLTAKNAEKNSFFAVGSLTVEKGENVVVSSELTKGKIRVELIGMPEEQSIEQLPEIDNVRLSADLTGTDTSSGTLPAGSYLLRATCLERASGSIRIEVLPE